ncbi:hypothetical protein K439DRAFT_1612288 [Ramaria rubella]|nr:hypothetical protein K439DRAFT_1612288 [Ramaria rubella]
MKGMQTYLPIFATDSNNRTGWSSHIRFNRRLPCQLAFIESPERTNDCYFCDMSLTSSLRPSRGFHFEFSTNLSLIPPRAECDLYLLHVLPADIFVDKYELKEHGLRFNLHGESNLELPLTAVGPEGSTLEVHVPPSMRVDVPLHARYPLSSTSSYSIVRVPQSQAYWACPGSTQSATDPFQHLSSPYTTSLDLDSWKIMFCEQSNDNQPHEIQVPAGRQADAAFVEFGTAFVVLTAFFYISRAVWATSKRRRHQKMSKQE